MIWLRAAALAVQGSTPPQPVSFILLECCLTLIACAFAFCLPGPLARLLTIGELWIHKLARKPVLSVLLVGLTELVSRVAILPFCPIPLPFVQDDFSFLLAANTFASGRLSNPTPPMWKFFESFQIDMQPTYMSMYFPAQGLILAAGKVVLGHPWFGLLCVNALMCAAFCWMLQAWLPPKWALLGGWIAVVRIGLFSYWINTYSGGGSIAALGGALLLGALPRFMRNPRRSHAFLMAMGISILVLSRPYEGLLLCVAALIYLAIWTYRGQHKHGSPLSFGSILKSTALPLVLILLSIAWLAYYDYRAFGNALTPPYAVNRATYAAAPYYIWQTPRPEPEYHHEVIRSFYIGEELGYAKKLHTLAGFLSETLIFKPLRAGLFYAGFALTPVLFFVPRALADRRTRYLAICSILVVFGVMIETWLIPHYLAAITAALYALGLQAMRHMKQWKPGGQPIGAALTCLCIVLCIAEIPFRLYAEALNLELARWPSGAWAASWSGPGRMGEQRAMVESRLNQMPEKQLVIVRYAAHHSSLDEWVYNAPDIEAAKVIWAREMSTKDNQQLLQHYQDRKVWLLEPDKSPVALDPYIRNSPEAIQK